MKTEYNVDYFIQKFEAIPDEDWGVGVLERGGKKCVLAICGVVHGEDGWQPTPEARALGGLFGFENWKSIYEINDGHHGPATKMWASNETTPKARILAALQAVKEGRRPLCPS